MKKEYSGVWSNDKKTIDIDNLNSKYEMNIINHQKDSCIVYVRKSETIVEKHTYEVFDDYFLDTGAITHKETYYKILGKNFKKIKNHGILDEEYKEFIKFTKEGLL